MMGLSRMSISQMVVRNAALSRGKKKRKRVRHIKIVTELGCERLHELAQVEVVYD